MNESSIQGIDLYPTLLELAGAKTPADYPLDGCSYAPQLLTPATAKPPHDALFWHFPGYLGQGKGQWRTLPVSVVHAGDWKLMQFLEDGRIELYNLRADPSEKNNLASSEPHRAKELLAKLDAWRDKVKAPLPRPITDADRNEPRKKRKAGGDNDD